MHWHACLQNLGLSTLACLIDIQSYLFLDYPPFLQQLQALSRYTLHVFVVLSFFVIRVPLALNHYAIICVWVCCLLTQLSVCVLLAIEMCVHCLFHSNMMDGLLKASNSLNNVLHGFSSLFEEVCTYMLAARHAVQCASILLSCVVFLNHTSMCDARISFSALHNATKWARASLAGEGGSSII